MNKILLLISSLVLINQALATTKLSFIVEGSKGKIEIKTPSIEILGFKNQPKNKSERKKLNDLIAYFDSQIAAIVKLDTSLGCHISKDKISLSLDDYDKAANFEATEIPKNEFIALFNIECQKELLGTKVTLDLTKRKAIKTIFIAIQLDESIQKNLETRNIKTTFDLK